MNYILSYCKKTRGGAFLLCVAPSYCVCLLDPKSRGVSHCDYK